jgi:hypothetical protein
MYHVFIPDADALRNILDRPRKLLGQRYCGYLIYLARSVDGPAVHFLEKFSAATDVETGEALAFLVLLDAAVLHGRNDRNGKLHERRREEWVPVQGRGWPTPQALGECRIDPRLPMIDVAETTSGAWAVGDAVARRFGSGSIPAEALYRANPEWSLKFAAHIGLDRTYLPCIVAMDDPGASDDDNCAVISLADADAAWTVLTQAISTYVAQPDTQTFMLAAERVRSAERNVAICDRALQKARIRLSTLERLEHADDLSAAVRRDVAGLGRAGQIITRLPSAPHDVLGWAAGLTQPDRHTVAAAALRARADHLGAATLRTLLDSPERASTARDIRRTLRRLRNTWLIDPTPDNPHLTKMIAAELTAALSYLDRSPDGLPGLVGTAEAVDRDAFLALVEARTTTTDAELADCWSHVDGFVRPQIPGVVRDELIGVQQATISVAERCVDEAVADRETAELALDATPMNPFVPHLAHAMDTMPGPRDTAKRARPSRTAIAVGGTAFVADLVQILQGLGILK